jgi:hypothetical protein
MRFSLKLRDWLKGLLMGVGVPVLYAVQELIPNWPLTPIEKIGLGAFVTYILKNLVTDDNKVAKKVLTENAASPEDKEKVAEIQTNK